jgi:DoxX-like family
MSTVAVQIHGATRLNRWLPWIGWLLSAGALSILLMSARWKLTFDPWYVQEWGRIGWATDALPRIALIQLACVVLYVTPPTAVLGAVLLTGYLGGAISQYTRIGEPIPVLVPLTTALLAWAGLYLREERLRSLLPFRRKAALRD